ncbi:MAG: hypothetical protein ABIG39_00340 [Candidatus Micrarchaeota archaeon]
MAEEDNANVISEEDEIVTQQEAALEEGVNAELEEKLPFPTARVVRLIKKNLKKEHQVRSEVKIAANVLLGEIIEDIAKQMDEEEYFTLSIDHFNKASKKYREVDLQLKRMENIKKMLEKQRAELEEKIMQIEKAEEWR